MDCNCESYILIGRVYRVMSEAYPSTAHSQINLELLSKATKNLPVMED